MDTINMGFGAEAELLITPRDEARRRLNRARLRMGETNFLPPGDEARDAAVRELRLALAVAAEMGI